MAPGFFIRLGKNYLFDGKQRTEEPIHCPRLKKDAVKQQCSHFNCDCLTLAMS